jgi:hypothetical protein
VTSPVCKPVESDLALAAIGENELFLAYVACRIKCELGSCLRRELPDVETTERIKQLAEVGFELLSSRVEAEAWLKGVACATELPDELQPSRSGQAGSRDVRESLLLYTLVERRWARPPSEALARR